MSREIASKSAARVLRPALACLPVLLLAACGGGGGGGGSASGPAPVAAVSITSTNQQAVAADALSTGTNTSYASAGTALVTGVQVDAGTGAASGVTGPALLAAVGRKLALMAPAGGAVATGAAVSQTLQCSGGGTLTVSGSVASSTSLNAGDTMTMSASGCTETVGTQVMTMNGALKIDITAGTFISGSAVYPQHVTMKLTATNLTLASAGVTQALNGDLTDDLSINSNIAASESLSGTAIAYSETTSAGKTGFSLKNYSESYSVNSGTYTFTVNESVETTNTRLGNVSYTIATNTPIVVANGVYTAGSITVTGNKSALQVTVTGNNTFQLQLDSNGDGTWDATVTKTLAELQQ